MHYLLFVTWIWDVQRRLRAVNSTPGVCKKYHLAKMAGIRSKLIKIKEKHDIARHFWLFEWLKCNTSHLSLERKVDEPFWPPSIYESHFTPRSWKKMAEEKIKVRQCFRSSYDRSDNYVTSVLPLLYIVNVWIVIHLTYTSVPPFMCYST